jgi:hypothetical protein
VRRVLAFAVTRVSAAEVLRTLSGDRALEAAPLVAAILLCGSLYGAFMGTYACDSPERLKMVAYAAVKVPLLVLATTALCLPGFFVFNTVAGLRDAFARALRAILAGQAGSAVALASLGPLIRIVYSSGVSHRWALLANSALFTLATLGGHMVLLRQYRRLVGEEPRHRLMLRLWLGMYAFVGTQLGWMLRPFVGAPGLPVTFFRDEPFSNAYVAIAQLLVS